MKFISWLWQNETEPAPQKREPSVSELIWREAEEHARIFGRLPTHVALGPQAVRRLGSETWSTKWTGYPQMETVYISENEIRVGWKCP